MPYRIDWEPFGVVKTFFDTVTHDEIFSCLTTVEADPRFDELRFVINDFTAVGHYAAHSSEDAHEVAAIDRAASLTNPRIIIAIVATHPDMVALCEGYAQSPLNPYPTRIFDTMAAARAWAVR